MAASILLEVEAGRRLDVAWEASGASAAPDRAWIRSLTFGTVRLKGRLDHLLTTAGRRPEELDLPVRTALRMGAYQIMEMGSVPAYAAVSQSVEQVKATPSRAAAGLVNAVLRKLVGVVAAPPAAWGFPDPADDLEGYLATWGSHPRWLVRRWTRHFGQAAARRLVEANNREPATYLRPVGTGLADAALALHEAGLLHHAEDPTGDAAADRPTGDAAADGPGRRPHRRLGACLRLRRGADPAVALHVVPGVIQDPAASLVVDHAAPPRGSLVADLCAAPGGKALALSAEAAGVVATDLRPHRLQRVAEGARRLDVPVWAVAADARCPPLHGGRGPAMVLADVPCTGTGTLRRRPDGRWRTSERTIARLAAVQRRILDGAASVVPLGGLLVYATCSLEPEENWGQVRAFLERRPDFRMEPGPAPARFLDEHGCLAVLPHETGPDPTESVLARESAPAAERSSEEDPRPAGFDGAFAARMRKTGD